MNEIKAAPAVTIRQPATANLMVDSADRTFAQFGLANDFQISKNNSILNGFFNRIGLTELVLEWFTPNISSANGNNKLSIDISGAGADVGSGTLPANLSDGFYTCQDVLERLTASLEVAADTFITTPPAITFTVAAGNGNVNAVITPSRDVWVRFTSPVAPSGQPSIAGLFGFPLNTYILFTTAGYSVSNVSPDLRGVRYLDFVSSQLTYNQDLKDTTTNNFTRDVLARWYMAYDNYTAVDGFNFPVLMGYEPFSLRRIFSPPKQIRWDTIQPVGNIAFQVYDDSGALATMTTTTNWLATLQVSEN